MTEKQEFWNSDLGWKMVEVELLKKLAKTSA